MEQRLPLVGRQRVVMGRIPARRRAAGWQVGQPQRAKGPQLRNYVGDEMSDLWKEAAQQALELIAAPMRPDGTWNRDREACRQLAAEVLRRDEDAAPQPQEQQ